MASPIMTDEELAEEGNVVAKKEENKGLKETMKEMASEGEDEDLEYIDDVDVEDVEDFEEIDDDLL